MPADPNFEFELFYDKLRERGYVIYPGKLTVADSFRIGCIGRLGDAEMNGALDAVRAVLAEMGVEVRRAGAIQERGLRAEIDMAQHPKSITVNGKAYAWPSAPLVVVCVDGSEPDYTDPRDGGRRNALAEAHAA